VMEVIELGISGSKSQVTKSNFVYNKFINPIFRANLVNPLKLKRRRN
jgi:hypothetical protein